MFRLLDWSVEELFLNLTCSFQHMIVAGVEAVGQSKLAEERISDDLDDRFALRVTTFSIVSFQTGKTQDY